MRKVLFISADQWRADCLSLLGHPTVQTPHLDQLAKDAVLFRRHYTTAAPCGPARASLLTGLYPMNHRSILNGTPLDARHTNLATEVRKIGFDPILFGYTDTAVDPRQLPPADPALTTYGGVLPGFKVGFIYQDAELLLPWLQELQRKGYQLPEKLFDAYLGQADYPGAEERGHSYAAPLYRAADSDTAFTAEQTLDYLKLFSQQPWFVHSVFLRPHPPLYAPEPYNAMYPPQQIASPVRAKHPEIEGKQHPFLRYWLLRQAEPGYYHGHPMNIQALPEHEICQLKASYYGLISEVDANLGRLIEHLKASGEYDETLIIFTVDHGEMLGDHWLWNKGGYFDASYHIPLIIRDPRADSARGRQVDAFTESVDIMPTILDWLGMDVPAQCDGVSLLPWLTGDTPDRWRDAVHWEYDFRDPVYQLAEQTLGLSSDQCTLNVIRDEQFKYVHFTHLPPLLFDLSRDPHEFENVAEDPAYQHITLRYAQKLLSLRMTHAERVLSNTLLTPEGVIEHRGPRW